MKVLLTTMNARYTHSSLAIAYLYQACQNDSWRLEKKEFTINDQVSRIIGEIYRIRPTVLCISCYIWNITMVEELIKDYKKIEPDCVIILGGPEVSLDARQFLIDNPGADVIVMGEGEILLNQVLKAIYNNQDLSGIKGIYYRRQGKIMSSGEAQLINDLNIVPSPYHGDISFYDHKMLYYETSRGCPFNCTYCLSSTIKGVRYFPMERVKKELGYLIDHKVMKIKFVDRTFNSNEKRAMEIMQYILDRVGEDRSTSFHFEICADIISDKMLDFLSQVPPGLFDFEIGVQSTCPETLKAINRHNNWSKLENAVKRIKSYRNIHIHIDLIAGLPYETYERFGQSFNDVYNLEPDVIQLGFLKLLKGSQIHKNKELYQYKFQSKAPYQIMENSFMSYQNIIDLEDIEELVGIYYNSAAFTNTIKYLVKEIYSGNAFKLFENFASFWRHHHYFDKSYKKEYYYTLLYRFIGANYPFHEQLVNELLKYDYLLNNRSYQVPEGLKRYKLNDSTELINQLLKDEEFLKLYQPELLGKTLREAKKYSHLEFFKIRPNGFTEATPELPILFFYRPGFNKCSKTIFLPETPYGEKLK